MNSSPPSPAKKFAKNRFSPVFALLALLVCLAVPLHAQYAGNYSGTAWGDVDGVWSMTVAGSGSISGRIVEEDDGLIYPVSGAVNASGAFTLVVSGFPSATFGGTIDDYGSVSGEWSDPSWSASGDFEGSRLPAGISPYAGSYSGTATGDLTRTWTATVSSVGNWDGIGVTSGGSSYRIAGIVGATGYIDVCIQGGGTMNGQIDTSGHVEGEWYDFWDEGTFSGQRNGPEIAVEQPVGLNIADGETVDFGMVGIGSGLPLTFTIKNTGNANLTGVAITKNGVNDGDFTVGALGATTLAAGGNTTFTVTFTPGAVGFRAAAIHIASNDEDENPFDIILSGTGLTSQEGWRQTYFGTTSNFGDAASTADPDRDGLDNLLEYAFGLHPLQSSTSQAPKFQINGYNLVCSFIQPTGVSGITYGAEWSATMAPDSWQPITDTGIPPQHTFAIQMSGIPQKFARLKVRSSEAPPLSVPDGFSLIPAGPFQMGDQSNPLVGDSSELPVHTVQVSAFYIAKNEVTKEEWDAVRAWGVSNGYTDLMEGNGGYASKGANHPVHSITWYDIVKWCNARSQKEGLTPCYTVSGATYKTGSSAPDCNWSANGYRLPTEAEWEKAARGGVVGKNYPWGGDTISHTQANYYSSTIASYDVSPTRGHHPTYRVGDYPYSSPVGSFMPNGYGLYDMAGNIWESCWDWDGSYSPASQTDPRGAATGSGRVYRGGSWFEDGYGGAFFARCAFRDGYGYGDPTGSNIDFGFRLARSSVP